MHELRAIIADTDDLFVMELESQLSEVWPEVRPCGRAKTGPEALDLIRKHSADLAFLEVRIPGMCGMQVARKIAGACRVVFTTAYDHYAVNAFESGAADYLVKPVCRERLEKTVRRLKNQMALSSGTLSYLAELVEQVGVTAPQNRTPGYLQWLRVQHGDGVRLVPIEEVCYFQANDKYTLAVTNRGESLISKPIKQLVDELDPQRYWRIHRGTIVNVAQIDRVSRSVTGRGAVRLKGRPEVLTVSRPYLHMFKEM